MIYLFQANPEFFLNQFRFQSLHELLFFAQCLSFSEIKQASCRCGFKTDEPLIENFRKAGVEISSENDIVHLSVTTFRKNELITVDFSQNPEAAIPFAVLCAVNGINADLRGLSALMNFENTDLISRFQRELYRFNILTDFCDSSKLKIYSKKKIQKRNQPLRIPQSELLCFHFLPMVFKFGTLESELNDSFFKKYQPLISKLKYSERK